MGARTVVKPSKYQKKDTSRPLWDPDNDFAQRFECLGRLLAIVKAYGKSPFSCDNSGILYTKIKLGQIV
ncbi:hypothetical protein JTE90_000395 [Oedothorax gibbosus]|uniref:Uncharacterized protein n=1 Tax=Oedothorax gibbosus TaxID=931172 RepID=A0AAV6UR28_9ARAC|nr:hypothetical protein JTE90_000395 [Oedothorax gibbosus]